MTKFEIEKLLREAGFYKTSGGKHDIWRRNGFPPIPVPRHTGDIRNGTVRNILKSAGIKVKK